jgi:TetR/AcrR family transcriptional repressor of lmrAB and yxaGH operons
MKQRGRDTARGRLVESAITLMRQSGLAGAGINEIVRASGAPKGSVYHYFPAGKRQIVAEGLDAYSQRVVAFIDASMAGRRGARTRVRALFEAFARRLEEGEFRHSCPIATVCLDLADAEDDLRPVLASAFGAYLAAIAAHLPLRDRQRARSFAGLMLTAIEGAYVRGRADRSSAPFREAGRWLGQLAEAEARR